MEVSNAFFLASGRGSNFQAFVDHVHLGVLKRIAIKGLICNHAGALVTKRAKDAGIEYVELEGVAGRKFTSRDERDQARQNFDEQCISIIKEHETDYVILAGFDQILTKSFIDVFPHSILNIHPAYDLKLFGGKNMVGAKVHEAVLSQETGYSGCSVHLVTAMVDQGPVILKKRVEVLPNDTAQSLENRILEQEHLAYPESLQLLVDHRVFIPDPGDKCYVDRYSDNWDIDWMKRQQSYVDYAKTKNTD